MSEANTAPSPRLVKLAEQFQALTYREMTTLAEVLVETLDATNGMKVKPQVMSEVLDAFGEYLAIEAGVA